MFDIEKLKSIQPQNKQKPKRKRRTKAEMEEARRLEAEQKEKPIKKSKSSYWDNCPPMKTTDDICREKLQEAIDKNLPDSDFDFREKYQKGNIVYFVEYNKFSNSVDYNKITITTVYPRFVVGFVDNGEAHPFGYSDRNNVFNLPKDAERYIKKLKKKANMEMQLNEA